MCSPECDSWPRNVGLGLLAEAGSGSGAPSGRSTHTDSSTETRKRRDVSCQEAVKKVAAARIRAEAVSAGETRRPIRVGEPMSVVIYIVLTVAIFALLGLVQRLVERL